MRVIAGRFGGRRLRVPAAGVRPTSDRVREALFASLGALEEARVLDLFAGSGALGIEALSRGAAAAVFAERSARAAAVVRANLASLGAQVEGRVLRGDAVAVVRRLARAGERFDLALLDPPWADPAEPGRTLRALATSGILAPGATLVVETARGRTLPEIEGLVLVDERRYGDTVIRRLARAGDPPGPGGRGASGRRSGGPMQEGEGAPAPHRVGRALFAASFDPLTNGHLDLIHRAKATFPELVVAVARNVAKQGTFTVDERLEILHTVLDGEPGIRITSFEGLLVDYAREIGARVLVRGLRAVSDFEYEFEMALMNKRMYPEIETLFMMTSQQFFYVSSSRLKELVRFGANVGDFVPPIVAKKLEEKLGGRS
ncbi:MAG TPA: pantetheine-phosphate adenylyltransferase [Myxococcota bacterium]|nr:pantetheine-phosphate adenylyltransferase [Myxococcota bacterium]